MASEQPFSSTIQSGPQSFNASTTYYVVMAESCMPAGAASQTEANRQIPVRTAGTFSYMRVTAGSANTGTVKFRVNGADGNQILNLAAAGQAVDTTHTDTVTAGALVCAQATIGTGALTLDQMGGNFASGTTTVSLFAATEQSVASQTWYQFANTNFFNDLTGEWDSANTEDKTQHKFVSAGTLKNGAIKARTNSRAVSTTFSMRKNGATSNISLVVPSSSTALVEDTTHTETVAADDLFCWLVNPGATTTTMLVCFVKCEYWNTNGVAVWLSQNKGTLNYATASASTRLGTAGDLEVITSPAWTVRTVKTVRNLRSYCSSTRSTTSTIAYSASGVNTALILSIAAGASLAWVTDTTHTAITADADVAAWRLTNGTGTGNLTIYNVSLEVVGAPDTNIASIDGVPYELVKTVHGLSHADNLVKTVQGLA